ncbi:Isoamyl acetate-hydrolyzing esterase 1 -like protein [Halotydeus destructor]|nr:Isoamyl acetate-hydrolyzing esterase 1 -like protein [Halotydeus destructor]
MSWSKVVLFGDSLTEYSLSPDGQWASLLGDRLKRVADIVVRGFGGYNTRYCRLMLPKLFPDPVKFDDVSCFVICLGANDCALEECISGQHVPLDEYKANLKDIVSYVVGKGLTRDKIIFMTPPKFYGEKFAHWYKMEFPENFKVTGPLKRSDEQTALYAQACVQVGQELGVDTVNLHDIFSHDSRGEALLVDGIHFSAEGSKLLFEHLWPLVEPKVLKHAGADKLTQNFPDFIAVNRNDPSLSF